MQTLYEWDFNGQNDDAIAEILEKNLGEFGPGLENREFPRQLVGGVLEHRETLDTIITKAAPEWPIAQIAMVDRNILRLGLFELIYGDHQAVPPKVAINEAIELAKSFGGESSGKFVNGVLGTVYRELGEPGKDHAKRDGNEPAKEEEYVGSVIFRRAPEGIVWAMVHDIFNHWTFVKGGRQPDESPEDAALREVREEVGISGVIRGELGENRYPATNEAGEKVLRRVTYFLVESEDAELHLETGGGLTDARWVPMDEVRKQKHYEDTNHIIDAAMQKIVQGP
ncbi:MAG: transcription antitermination factor NusB [Candidatus Sungbacteria bacterium RIFCSPLOWO2_01_FULL_59_16]|uniref:Transcription antitermination protein NusB n=1 Tax=Candidatus Sungbacteria bacterium RIFCSPLOWO2_01_FULL_59_16 TaxID=1802280 RepID=A0A1G2LER1_9BACT|nr:MAG: transcription antitermination factor NusB [Candidatus Sungbacteria bacterium RIFCSPLOWO2_01_FULL_59_16]